MMHRTKKINDENHDKWVGIGGKFEFGETPYDCARREILEETGLTPDSLFYRGIITFVSDRYGTEYMHLFTCNSFSGILKEDCNEGELVWIDKNRVYDLPIWEGDKIFFRLIVNEEKFFSLKLVYEGEHLVSYNIEYR